jgi:thiol-disulfide isomerase/thioredoxin
MSLTPDALVAGPLALSWPNLALLLGVLVFTGLAARRGLESKGWWVLLATLLAARVGFAVEHLETWPSLGAMLLGIVDIRSGGWSWPWGVVGGVAVAGAVLRQQAPALLTPALAAIAVGVLPLGVQQELSRSVKAGPAPETILAYLEPGQQQLKQMHWNELPKPMLVSFWATWCASCRATLPVLAEYQQKGYPVVLLNAGEAPGTILAYQQQAQLSFQVWLDNGVQRAFRVGGLPTTVLIGSDGQVLSRHMGPLNRAQLEQLLKQLE